MKAIIFSKFFQAPDELNEFCKSIGYENPNYQDFDLMFDQRIIEFCKKNLKPLWGEKVYIGRGSLDFRIGFAGAGYIREININRLWNIKYNQTDAPIINYIEVSTNKYGFTTFLNYHQIKERKK